jgi:multisubunit Na+/H+ antiporter MnhB subunit
MKWRRWLLLPLILALAAGLGYTVLSLPDQAQGLQGAVADQLEKSGVTNPVTAVLLNFRGYDTLLEMVVLLFAVIHYLQEQEGIHLEVKARKVA